MNSADPARRLAGMLITLVIVVVIVEALQVAVVETRIEIGDPAATNHL